MSRTSFTLVSRSVPIRVGVCALAGAFTLWIAQGPATAGDVLPDPTRPPAVVAAELIAPEAAVRTSALSLQAIFFAEGRRVAIINDRRLRERDLVEGARLVRIARDHVELQRGEERLELRLISGGVKQGSSPNRTSAASRSNKLPRTEITVPPSQPARDLASPSQPDAARTHASADDRSAAGPPRDEHHETPPASRQQGMSP